MFQPNLATSTRAKGSTNLGKVARQAIVLFKLRVVSLLLLAAIGGAFLGNGGSPSLPILCAILITGTLAAGGASAINEYLERGKDQLMHRTQRRPLATGNWKHPAMILGVGIAMILLAVLVTYPFNPVMAFFLGLGAVIYVGIYTIWLKPRTVLNIVIGGAAGSCAVLTGGAAVGAAADPAVIVLALLVFLWTPVHFWALAMFYRDDYQAAEIPMLPVQAPQEQSARWILIHALSAVFAALLLGITPHLGWAYLVPTGIFSALLIYHSLRLLKNPGRKEAIRLFLTSNEFLGIIMVTVVLVTWGRQLFLQ